MALYLSNVTDAYGPLLTSHWEKDENPQHYDDLTSQYVNPRPQRHILGIVGGNEVSLIKGNMVDLESDLRGITIPNTFAPWHSVQHLNLLQRMRNVSIITFATWIRKLV